MPDTAPARAKARQALEDAIEAYLGMIQEECEDCDDIVPVDAVLIVGSQWIDSDGDRGGGISVLPRHGSQPYYSTLGLIEAAKAKILDTQSNE